MGWLVVGPVRLRSPVPQEDHCGLPAMHPCVKIVGILGEATPMKKCICVSCRKVGTCRVLDLHGEGPSGLARVWLGKAREWTTSCRTGRGRLRHVGMAVEGSVLLSLLTLVDSCSTRRKKIHQGFSTAPVEMLMGL